MNRFRAARVTAAPTFRNVKPAAPRDGVTSEADPHRFALSYDYVGDLGETTALIWPHHGGPEGLPSPATQIEGRYAPTSP